MRKTILTMLLCLVTMASLAQERLISGQITDRDTKDPVEQGRQYLCGWCH